MDPFDVIVVGGGPGGSTCATFLARDGHRVLLLDKATFPRDKPCGDAISGKSASVLREMGVQDLVEEAPHAIAEGVVFSGPRGDVVQIPFPKDIDPTGIKNSKKYNYVTAGYVCRREVYDNILFQHAKSQKSVTTLEGVEVKDVLFDGPAQGQAQAQGRGQGPGQAQGQGRGRVVGVRLADGREFRAPLVVGADGAMSVVAQKVGAFERDHDHWIGSFRVYFDGVTGMTNDIEIHFVEGLIPGYFWIFPLDNGWANVGSGMIETDLRDPKKSIKLVEDTYKIMREHPMFKERFANAKEIEGSRRGWLLPLGSKHRPVAGDGWMLIGDAAALIDPFSGEGIGNAMVSARLAAATANKALAARDVSQRALLPYEVALRTELDRELQMSYKLQKLGRRTWLLNYVLRRAAKSENVRHTISAMLADREKKEDFGNFWFYLRLLLK